MKKPVLQGKAQNVFRLFFLPQVILGIGLPLLGLILLQPQGPVGWFLIPGLWCVVLSRFSDLTWAGLGIFFLFLILYATSIPVEVYYFWFHQLPQITSGPPALVLWAGSWFVCLLGITTLYPSKLLLLPLLPQLVKLIRKTNLPSKTQSIQKSGFLDQKSQSPKEESSKVNPWVFFIGLLYSSIGIPILLSGSGLASLGFLSLGAIYGFVHLRKYPLQPRLAWFGILALVVGGILILPEPTPVVRESWDQRLIRYFNTRFQDIPLILDIPGQGTRQINDSFGPARGLSPRVLFQISSPSDGVLYLENRRAWALNTNGWMFSQQKSPLSENLSQSQILVEVNETWWGSIPSRVYLNRWYLPSYRSDQVPSTPLEPQSQLSFRYSLDMPETALEPKDTETEETEETEERERQGLAIPQEIIDLADQVRHLPLNQQIQVLKNYLRDQYIYGLLPANPSANSHPLSTFLEDRLGYCVHFATFGVLFFQDLGYEAWYSEGYTGLIRGGQGELRGLDSHAWVTLVLEDGPPIIVDPTPGVRFDPLLPGNHAMDRATLQYLSRLQNYSQASPPSSPVNLSTQLTQVWKPFSLLIQWLMFLSLIFVGFGLILFLRPKKRWIRQMVQGRAQPMSYQDMEQLIGKMDTQELYLPSLLAWYGYTPYPNYYELLRNLRVLKTKRKSQSLEA